jgi:hypothetical protein
VDLKTGAVRWTVPGPEWLLGLHRGRVVVLDVPAARLLLLDPRTGKEAGRSEYVGRHWDWKSGSMQAVTGRIEGDVAWASWRFFNAYRDHSYHTSGEFGVDLRTGKPVAGKPPAAPAGVADLLPRSVTATTPRDAFAFGRVHDAVYCLHPGAGGEWEREVRLTRWDAAAGTARGGKTLAVGRWARVSADGRAALVFRGVWCDVFSLPTGARLGTVRLRGGHPFPDVVGGTLFEVIDNRFRAVDVASGKERWIARLHDDERTPPGPKD